MSLCNLNCFFFFSFQSVFVFNVLVVIGHEVLFTYCEFNLKTLWHALKSLNIKTDFLEGLGLFCHIMLIWFWINLCLLIPKLKLICNVIAMLFLTYLSFKACVRYFFFFFALNDSPSRTMKNAFFHQGTGFERRNKINYFRVFW